MNNIEDQVSFDYNFYIEKNEDLTKSIPISKKLISKLSFGKSIVDRLDYQYGTSTLQYFQIVGESQKITLHDTVYTTQKQKHYLWKTSENTNIYNKEFLGVDAISNNNPSMMIGTLELNFVPEYESLEKNDFLIPNIIKILIPVFKTNHVNKNGIELLNCIRMASDIAIPTKNIDMGDFIPKNVPYYIKVAEVDSSIKVGTFIFTSSNIHLDDNTIQPHFFNIINKHKDIGDYTPDDISTLELYFIEKGVEFKTQEKNCRELHYEGETFTHATNKNTSVSIEDMPIEERLGKLIQSPLGLQIVVIAFIFIILMIYKIIVGGLLSRIGETSQSWFMSKAGTHYSTGAFVIFIILFISFVHMMSDDFWSDEFSFKS